MKSLQALILFGALAFVTISFTDGSYFSTEERRFFNSWCKKHDKHYRSKDEEEKAIENLMNNKKMVEEHNEQYKKGLISYELQLFHHSDLSEEEMAQHLEGYDNSNGTDVDSERATRATKASDFPEGPASIDWRDKGIVSPVEDQGHCGSCWAFSTTSMIDTLILKKHGHKRASPQQLIDCFKRANGCHGGNPTNGLIYAKKHGITSESEYPYKEHESKCEYDEDEKIKKATIKKVHHIELHGDEKAMANIIAKVGPVAIALCANHKFKHYHGGFFKPKDCCGAKGKNHAPVIGNFSFKILIQKV